MKKTILITALIGMTLFITSCGHNLGLVGIGTGWRVGNGEYGLAYGDGIFGTFVTRDGVQFKAELDSTTGFSYDPSTNTYKGIKSFEYSLPMQVNGYSVDFAKNNPEVAKLYYEALIKYYEIKRDTPQVPLIDDAKSTEATKSAADVLKEAVANAYKKWLKPGADEPEPFVCPDGNCKVTGLDSNKTVKFQAAVAAKALQYADSNEKPAEEGGHTMYQNLVAFATRMAKFKFEGRESTKMYISFLEIKDHKLVNIKFLHDRDDGTAEEIDCVECVAFDD